LSNHDPLHPFFGTKHAPTSNSTASTRAANTPVKIPKPYPATDEHKEESNRADKWAPKGFEEPLRHQDVAVDPVKRLPFKKVTVRGTVCAPNWNPPDATESEVTQAQNRSYEDTLAHPNPYGDPTERRGQRYKFERPADPEPKVSFDNNGVKRISFASDPAHAAFDRNAHVIPPGEKQPRRRIVDGKPHPTAPLKPAKMASVSDDEME
jgi:hypothetical protein